MLSIVKELSATDLLADATGRGTVLLQVTITEDDPFLANKLVAGELNWGDGSLAVPLPQQVSPIATTISNSFAPGLYTVRISATNFRTPTPDTQLDVFTVTVRANEVAIVNQGIVFGPILPRDGGFPNDKQWNFNTGQDIQILESALKMLLTTEKGERLMEPDYGTNLRSVLFENDTRVAQGLVQQEIATAVQQREPRVMLSSISLSRNSDMTSADVRATFISRLSQQPFQVNLKFVR